jgi:hypothetical protein
MTGWTSDELAKIEAAEELEIASARRDGTLPNPRTIWVVRVGDDLYVRSMYGPGGGWFPGTQVRHQGYIRAGGVDNDVTFATPIPTATTRSAPPTVKVPPLRREDHRRRREPCGASRDDRVHAALTELVVRQRPRRTACSYQGLRRDPG